MRILIVSDTHRRDENLKEVIRRTGPLDMMIHLGDAEGSEHAIATWVNEDCDLEMILGNNDRSYCRSGVCDRKFANEIRYCSKDDSEYDQHYYHD